MTQIRSLFDTGKDIHRTIEKVITYQASQEQRLKAEISEYIATESIEQQLEQLLEKMQAAMEAGSSHEIGVWVSGFYGSGKSSFTKYLGLAFDEREAPEGRKRRLLPKQPGNVRVAMIQVGGGAVRIQVGA